MTKTVHEFTRIYMTKTITKELQRMSKTPTTILSIYTTTTTVENNIETKGIYYK